MQPSTDHSHMRWPGLLVAMFLAGAVGLLACELPNEEALTPTEPDLFETCVLCGNDEDGWYVNPLVDSIRKQAGTIHNEDLAINLTELIREASTYGPLSQSHAKNVIRPTVEHHLASEGITVPPEAWTDVPAANERYWAGDDIVTLYAYDGMTLAAQSLARELLRTVDLFPDTFAMNGKLDSLLYEADIQLVGDELEAFSAAVGIAQYSANYWSSVTNQADWNGSIAANGAWDDFVACGWRMLGGDVAGGVFAWLRMPAGGWFSAAYGAAVGSTMAAALGC